MELVEELAVGAPVKFAALAKCGHRRPVTVFVHAETFYALGQDFLGTLAGCHRHGNESPAQIVQPHILEISPGYDFRKMMSGCTVR